MQTSTSQPWHRCCCNYSHTLVCYQCVSYMTHYSPHITVVFVCTSKKTENNKLMHAIIEMWNVMKQRTVVVIIIKHYTHLLLLLLLLICYRNHNKTNTNSSSSSSNIMDMEYENLCKHEMRCTVEMSTWVGLHCTQPLHNFLQEIGKIQSHCRKSSQWKKKM